MTGMIMGTAAYMAPSNQSTAPAEVDGRADLFSARVVCYEALTGHLPGRFEDPLSRSMVSSKDSLRKWNAFWLSLLERDPASRPASAGKLL